MSTCDSYGILLGDMGKYGIITNIFVYDVINV